MVLLISWLSLRIDNLMNLCSALIWTDLCDLVVLTYRVGLNLSLIALVASLP